MIGKFKFEVNDTFGLVGRGLVFRGNVIEGSLDTNQSIKFYSDGVNYLATVSSIEVDRKIVKETVQGIEIGLMLTNFNVEKINDLYMNAPDIDELEGYPTVKEALNIEYPCRLESE